MSIRKAISVAMDGAALAMLAAGQILPRKEVRFLPVLHVERLNIDQHFHGLLNYCREYKELTQRKIVCAVVTPLSPFMAFTKPKQFSEEAYSERIAELAECAIIGLHGHFVRNRTEAIDTIWPMQNSWFDLTEISMQLRMERDWLLNRGYMQPDKMIYAAGWWFMNDQLRRLLINEGFRYDFSISQNRYCRSYSAWKTMQCSQESGEPVKLEDSSELLGAMALSATAQPDRPAASLRRLTTDCGLKLYGRGKPLYFTFYGHDYDLPVGDAIVAIELLQKYGFGFFEPSDLD